FGSSFMAGARLTNSAAINIATGVPTALTFDTARTNSGGWISTDSSKFTVTTPGMYAVFATASFAANGTGQRTLQIKVNGSTTVASSRVEAAKSGVTDVTVGTIYELDTDDYVEIYATQNSGGNLDVLKAANYSPEFAVLWAGSNSVTTVQGNNGGGEPSSTPPSGGNTITNFQITDVGWYRVWEGAYPASGSFNIVRPDGGDGQTSDTIVDFTITAQSPEGVINIKRNAIPSTGSPSIDSVRIYHDATANLAYVEAHLLRSGEWKLTRSSDDTSYLDAPYLVADAFDSDGSLAYDLKP